MQGYVYIVSFCQLEAHLFTGISTHQKVSGHDWKRNMHYFTFHLIAQWWHAFLRWRITKPHDSTFEFGSKNRLVIIECFFCIPVEIEIRANLCHVLKFLMVIEYLIAVNKKRCTFSQA